jgi:phosphopantetheinyl transferase
MNRHDLLKKVLEFNYNIKDYELLYSKNGKPSLVGKQVYFNLSSSQKLSAIATSKVAVGICIEHYFYDLEILDTCFNEKEKEIIAKSDKKEHDFTRIYTLKIAYIKMLDFERKYSLVDIDTTQLKNWSTNENKDYFVSVVENKNVTNEYSK